MISTREEAQKVIDHVLEDNSQPYRTNSCQLNRGISQAVDLFYADTFVQQISTNHNGRFLEEFAKSHQAALAYGYVGASGGKQNGIVDITPLPRNSDENLMRVCQKLLTPEIVRKYKLPDSPQPVKIVAHVPSGNRLVGVLDKRQPSRVFILGIASYRGKPKW